MMKRRGFLKWLGAIAAAVAIDPLLGGQSVWGTEAPKPKPLGVKGSTFLDTGFVYAPYIPIQITPTFLGDVGDARYSKKRLRTEWYGKVTITDDV